jgi:hypothetical protein
MTGLTTPHPPGLPPRRIPVVLPAACYAAASHERR